ncbi:MAG: DUF4032 domain-containing protein [Actinomycetaceae bacterium]|nr:DUF4032 domain-containing protein [Arcanobacterium sp.]MDD7505509.1 DUF4032 domain-containing protein [Actinomycetaceae bacterium]
MDRHLEITSAKVESALLDLPWSIPLAEWPDDIIAALPRGISRHVVRFVNLGNKVIAIKEISAEGANHEYETLRDLNRLEAPCVEPIAVITGRENTEGKPLNAALVTQHLPYSLPYRALFGQAPMRPETAERLIDALSVLMVRLHLLGFFWGDVSLSNTLFRRDAGEFAAYLVDAETGELYSRMSDQKREYDVDIAFTNIIGEFMDLQAGDILEEDFDAIGAGNRFVERYNSLWAELTSEEQFSADERWRVDNRIRRLNELGFDVGELSISTDIFGTSIRIRPKVVDAGHYSRTLMRLTGMDVQEKQARRLMNDIESYRAMHDELNVPLSIVAHEWMTNVFEPAVRAIPKELRGKLQPAQVFHELLDHRWFASERAGHDVPMQEAVQSYIEEVLKHRPDESFMLTQTSTLPAIKTDFDDDWSGYMADD